MKNKFLCMFLTLCIFTTLFTGITVFASTVASGTCGENLTWVLDTDGVLTISGTGEMEDYYASNTVRYKLPPYYSYNDDITKIVIEEGMTRIGSYAFHYCRKATEVSIPQSVTAISSNAFSACYKLKSIVIPDGVTAINYSTFMQCYALESVTIPDSVTYIGQYAFSECRALDNVIIPEGVKDISADAFNECWNLKNIKLPDNLETIQYNAFSGCKNLEKIEIPESVISIEHGVFGYCYNLTELKIPKNVQTIGKNAFSLCYDLLGIYVDEENPSYCSVDGVLFDKNKTTIIHYPAGKSAAQYTIPDGVKTIGYAAICHDDDLTSVVIPRSVETISDYGFDHCDSLKDIYFSGTKNEWKNVKNDCDFLGKVKIHYKPIDVTVNGQTVSFPSEYVQDNYLVYVTFFDSEGIVDGVQRFTVSDDVDIVYENAKTGAYARVMLWNNFFLVKPVCESQDIEF